MKIFPTIHFCLIGAASLFCLPTGPSLISGEASFCYSDKNLSVVTGNTAVVDWELFSVESDEMVRFIQPSPKSIAINRILGTDLSVILGKIEAPGQIVLINQNGILFGKSAQINIGALFASTLPLDLDAFKETTRKLSFSGISQAKVTIDAALSCSQLVVSANQIELNGTIRADRHAIFAGSSRFDILPEDAKSFFAGPCPEGSLVLTTGSIYIPGGEVVLTAQHVRIERDSLIDASGPNGGGSIFVGGESKGSYSRIAPANTVFFSETSSLLSNGLEDGNGGSIVLWANQNMTAKGTLAATGGFNSGDGGFLEVSSAGALDFNWRINTQAPNGKTGKFLLDPSNVIINDTFGATTGIVLGNPSTISAATANVRIADLNTALGASNITIDTNVGSGAAGDITVTSAFAGLNVTWNSNNTLTLIATRDVILGARILDTSPAFTTANRIQISAGRDILMNAVAGTQDNAVVGSQNGGTSLVATNDLTMGGVGNRNPQIGFLNTGTSAAGPIQVACRNLTMRSGVVGSTRALIGHGDATTSAFIACETQTNMGVSPNIQVNATGNITMINVNNVGTTMAQIGHGSINLTGGAGCNQAGDIAIVCGGNLLMDYTVTTGNAFGMIGHGGSQIGVALNPIPTVSGNIDVQVGGNIDMLAGNQTGICTIIGHHGLRNPSVITNVTGNMNVCCGGNANLQNGSGVSASSLSVIGHASVGTLGNRTITGNYQVNIGGNLILNNRGSGGTNRVYIGGIEALGVPVTFNSQLNLSVGGNVQLFSNVGTSTSIGIGFATPLAVPLSVTQVCVAIGGNLQATGISISRAGVCATNGEFALAVRGNIDLSVAGPGTNRMALGTDNLLPTAVCRIYAGGNISVSGAPNGNNVLLGVDLQNFQAANFIDVRAGGDLQWTTNLPINRSQITLIAGHDFGPGELWTSSGNQLLTVAGFSPSISFPIQCGSNPLFTAASPGISSSCGAFSVPTMPNGPGTVTLNTTGALTLNSKCSTCSSSSNQSLIIGGAGSNISFTTSPSSFVSASFFDITVQQPISTTAGQIYISSCNDLSVANGSVLSTAAAPGQPITLIADIDDSGVGSLNLQANATTLNGDIYLAAGPGSPATGTSSINQTGNSTVSTGAVPGAGTIRYEAGRNILINGSSTSVLSTLGGIDMTAGANIEINQLITSTSGHIFTTAGNDTSLNPLSPGASFLVDTGGEVLMITGNNIYLLGLSRIRSFGNRTTLVVDNDFPSPPLIGTGFLLMEAGARIDSGPGFFLQIYTAQQSLNTIQGLLNGLLFSRGTLFSDSAQEVWCTYYPDGQIGLPFTIYYKDCLAQVVQQSMEIVDEFLTSLHPYNEFPGWVEKFFLKYDLFLRQPDERFYIRRRHIHHLNHPKTFTVYQ